MVPGFRTPSPRQFNLQLLAVFTLVSMALAGLGLYGVVSLPVSSRPDILVLLGIAPLTCHIPAARESRVDPVTVLRQE